MASGRGAGVSRTIAMLHRLTTDQRRLIKFALVGGSNTVLTVGTYALLVELSVFYVLAGVAGWSVGLINGYTWNRIWTFRAGSHEHELLAKYSAVAVLGLTLNSLLLLLVVDVAGASKIIGQVVVLPVVMLSSFAANRFWTFGEHVDGPESSVAVGAGPR